MLLSLSLLVATTAMSAAADPPPDSFTPGAKVWADTDGEHIVAHGGGILEHDGIYYWYGEQRWGKNLAPAVRCYQSTDLLRWENKGVVLSHEQVFENAIFERPKVIYNEATDRFVMWWHQELPGLGYDAARVAVAVSESPTGPFEFLHSYRPNVGRLPMNAPIDNIRDLDQWRDRIDEDADWEERAAAGELFLRDLPVGQMARDMTLFKDIDGTAYLVFSSEENRTLHVAELDESYTGFTGRFRRVLPGGRNEAPAVWRHDGKYYMIASGLTGWDPNPARSYVAESMLGEWTPLGSPMRGGPNPHNGIGPDVTFGGQSTHVLAIGDGRYIAMFDVWTPDEGLNGSRYIWLPITMEDGKPLIEWRDTWTLEDVPRNE